MAIEESVDVRDARSSTRGKLQYFAAWTAIAVLFWANSIVVYVITLRRRPELATQPYGPREWLQTLPGHLADWYLWALLAPLVYWLARRIRIERSNWMAAVAIHLLLSIALAGAKVGIRFLIARSVSWLPAPLYLPGTVATLPINIATYWAIVAASYAFEYHRRYRDREIKAAQLESRLAQAQLRALQAQLQPHFLFNTLHSVSVLIREGENDAADRMLTRLSDLLRLSLDAVARQEQPLSKELEFVAGYVAIQQVRFQDRLVVSTSIDPSAMDALVPTHVLQPLVENAIQHGIAPRPNGGRVTITATREASDVRISVRDDGPGMTAPAGATSGVGLANTRARLDQLYGAAHRFDIRSTAGGLTAELRFPFRQA